MLEDLREGQRWLVTSSFPILVFCVNYVLPCTLRADAIVTTRAMTAATIAEVFVEPDAICLDLEIGSGDLHAFRNLMPDEIYETLGYPPQPLENRLRLFFSQGFVLQADDDRPLAGVVQLVLPRRRVLRDEVTGEPLAVQPEDAEPVVFVKILYPLDKRPSTLLLKPPHDADASAVAASIGFVVYHRGLLVNDFRYLSSSEMLDLDWEDPWYSRFRNPNLRRQFDAPLSVFLYVEPFEVRKEIIVRPKDLQRWLDLGIDGQEVITVEQQEPMMQGVVDFLDRQSPVTINGKRAAGELERIHFIRRSLRQTGVVDPPEDVDAISATLGVVFVYPTSRLPREATVTWGLFEPKMQRVPAVATDEAGGLPSTLTPEDPVLRWQNFLTNPTTPAMLGIEPPPNPPSLDVPVISTFCVSLLIVLAIPFFFSGKCPSRAARMRLSIATVVLVLLGAVSYPYPRLSLASPFSQASRLDDQQANDVLAALLHNIYHSFNRRDENLVYERLAMSIAGDLLTEVYLQTRQSMELANQGGARVKVNHVQIQDSIVQQLEDRPGFASTCRWTVVGSVGHWGHTHERVNQYEAIFSVQPIDAVWKITALELLDERRVENPLDSSLKRQ